MVSLFGEFMGNGWREHRLTYRHGTLHFNRPLHHAVDAVLGQLPLRIVVEENNLEPSVQDLLPYHFGVYKREKRDVLWKFPSPTCPTIELVSPEVLRSLLVSSIMSGSLLMGTATSPVQT